MSKAMEEAKTAIAELLEAARVGNIIPVRLPGQVEAIQALLLQAKQEHTEAMDELRNAPGGDAGAILLEDAEFIKTALHELRTPMTSIRGYSDMLGNEGMAGELSDMQKQLLQVVRANAKRMESLLADMSYVNKLRAGIFQATKMMDLFKNIAMRAEKAMTPVAEKLNRQLEFDIPQGLPLLNTDGELMALAMDKLIENGLRYSPEGTGKVVVHGRGEGNTLVVTIEDNGCGMTEEEMQPLGTLFYRTDNDTVRAYKGSGLGVFIAYRIIDLIGGRYEVTSQPGKGTTFTLHFEGMT